MNANITSIDNKMPTPFGVDTTASDNVPSDVDSTSSDNIFFGVNIESAASYSIDQYLGSDLSYSIIKVELPHTPTDTLVEFRVQRTEKNREEFARLAGHLRRKLGGLLNVNFAW